MIEVCLGGLGWSPEQFWETVSYAEVVMAWRGYARRHGAHAALANPPPYRPDVPDASFMDDMLARFPD